MVLACGPQQILDTAQLWAPIPPTQPHARHAQIPAGASPPNTAVPNPHLKPPRQRPAHLRRALRLHQLPKALRLVLALKRHHPVHDVPAADERRAVGPAPAAQQPRQLVL